MIVAIMQPYFVPYIGYFQLIGCADLFILHDDVKYTKKGWINRNRILQNGRDEMITLPLRGASDALTIGEREIDPQFRPEKLLAKLRGAYAKAPRFVPVYALVESILAFEERNLFRFLSHSLAKVCDYLQLRTPMRPASSFALPAELRAQDRVIALCKAAGASEYVNPIGGTTLYSSEAFAASGLRLRFLRALPFEYPQFGAPFVPWLSILDVLMFNSPDAIERRLATGFEFV